MHCSAMVFLFAWGTQQMAEGRRISLSGDDRALARVARMDVDGAFRLNQFGLPEEPDEEKAIPLRAIASAADAEAATRAVRSLITAQCPSSDQLWPAVEWAVFEILDNVLNHSDTEQPGAICGQFFPGRNRLDIAICDVGQGIHASLSQAMSLFSHGHAVSEALRRGVTRNQEIGQGNGLAGVKEIAVASQGNFDIWTGNVVFHAVGGEDKGFTEIPEIPGTGVMFSLKTDRPVDLKETWIAGVVPEPPAGAAATWAAGIGMEGGGPNVGGVSAATLSSVAGLVVSQIRHGSESQALNSVAEAVGGCLTADSQDPVRLSVGEECVSCGTRSAARELRRKVVRLLVKGIPTVILDFSEVPSATSSFLDELLGRLVAEVGEDEAKRRIKVEGMSELLARITTVVVTQRLTERPGPGNGDR